jgi:hypothetical protein
MKPPASTPFPAPLLLPEQGRFVFGRHVLHPITPADLEREPRPTEEQLRAAIRDGRLHTVFRRT